MTDAPALERMRIDYASRPLDVDDLAPTWYEQLTAWLEQAREAGLTEPNAMVLATSDPDGLPSSRTVLCKGLDAGGIVFYTNYTSAKSHDLNRTRVASVTFPWYDLQRQVQLSGRVERCSESPTPTGRCARAGHSWGRGRRRSRRSSPGARSSTRRSPGSPAASRASRRSRDRRTGVAGGSCRGRSSSGRAAPTGCTTGCGSRSAARTPGRCAGSPPRGNPEA